MIYQLFIGLFGVAFLFLFYGWYSRTDAPRLIGFLLIFILGCMLEPVLPGNVEYRTGEEIRELYVYGDNYTGYHWDYINPPPPGLSDVNLFHVNRTITYTYTDIQAHTLGFFLSIAGILGFVLVMVDRRREEEE